MQASIAENMCTSPVHLLRDLERVRKYKDHGGDWEKFCKKLKRLVRDAIRLQKRKAELDEATSLRLCGHLEKRLQLMLEYEWSNKEAKRLVKRLTRHQNELFTFLHDTDVPFDNNFGERSIRGAVIMRKNSFNNRSQKGAMTQSVLMSVFSYMQKKLICVKGYMNLDIKYYSIPLSQLRIGIRLWRADMEL